MKHSLNELNNRLDTSIETISDLEENKQESYKLKYRGKTPEGKKKKGRDWQENTKRMSTCIIEMPEEIGKENNFGGLSIECFLNMIKIYNPKTKEDQQIKGKINKNKTTAMHIIMKLRKPKSKEKVKILKQLEKKKKSCIISKISIL